MMMIQCSSQTYVKGAQKNHLIIISFKFPQHMC